MFFRIKSILVKEFRQLFRDRRSLSLLLVLPVFLLVMFGYVVTFDVKHIRLGVEDRDRTSLSRTFISYFTRSEYFDQVAAIHTPEETDRLLDEGQAAVVMVIPRGFARELGAGQDPGIQFLIDGVNAQSAATVLGYVKAMVRTYSLTRLLKTLTAAGSRHWALPVEIRPQVWYNPEMESARFLIPGLIGFIMMVTAVISTSLSIVRERERGTMEQIRVSPVHPLELIIGKTIPYVCISLTNAVMILGVSYLLFGVAVKGSYLLLTGLTILFLAGSISLGLFISTIAETQQVAFMISVVSTMLPTFVLSGFVFPIRNMPLFIRPVTYLVPARYFLVILRGIILKGAGWAALWDQVLFLGGYTLLAATITIIRMKKRGW